MGLSSTTSRWIYSGNDATDTFSFNAKILAASDLVVTKRLISTGAETTLVLNTDYTVTGIGLNAGGSITLDDGALPSTYRIVIRRVRPLTQETDIRNQLEFYAEIHEDKFDELTMLHQQQQDQLDRSVALPETLTSDDFDPTLPVDLPDNASCVPLTNASGDGWADAADWPSASSISGASASAAAAAASAVDAAASATSASDSETNAAASAAAAAASAASAAAAQSGTRAAPNDITAAGGITADASNVLHCYVQGSGGAVTVTANPQVSAGTNVGQMMLIIGRSDSNTVTLANGNGLSLNGDIVLGQDDTLHLYWDGVNWSEISRRR